MALFKTLLVKASSTAEVVGVVTAKLGRQLVLRAVEATGLHASSKLTAYIPRAEFQVPLSADLASDATGAKLASEHDTNPIVRGHTLTTSDRLLIQTSSGLALKAISNVACAAGVITATIVATGKALGAGTLVNIVRAADMHNVTIGNASISKVNLFAGEIGQPFALGATSGDATATNVSATGEWVEG